MNYFKGILSKDEAQCPQFAHDRMLLWIQLPGKVHEGFHQKTCKRRYEGNDADFEKSQVSNAQLNLAIYIDLCLLALRTPRSLVDEFHQHIRAMFSVDLVCVKHDNGRGEEGREGGREEFTRMFTEDSTE